MMTTLVKAAWENDLQKVKKMIKNGVNVNSQDNRGWTALICASQRGHYNMLEYLIQCGSDLNITSIFGTTALMLACSFGHMKVIEYLVRHGADLNIRRLSKQRLLMEATGYTALIEASEKGRFDIVKLLLQCGADPNLQDKYGRTALDIAKKYKYVRVAAYIEQYPAYLAAMRSLIPKLAPHISLASCANIHSFV